MKIKRASWSKMLVFTVLTLILLSMFACSAQTTSVAPAASTSAQAPATSAASSASSATKATELSLAFHSQPGHFFTITAGEWAQQIEEKTGGQIKITLYPSESLVKVTDISTSVKGGICDIGWMLGGMSPGAMPLSDLMGIPRVGSPTRDLATAHTIFDKYLADTEFKDVKMLLINVLGPNFLHTSKKSVGTLADFSGLQIRAQGGGRDAWIKASGGTPVIVPSPEVYTSLERGMIDGALMPLENAKSGRLNDVTKYHTDIGDTCNPSYIIMNLKVWNSLSPDVQKVFNDLQASTEQTLRERAIAFDDSAKTDFQNAGGEFLTLSSADLATWDAAFAPVIAAKIADVDAKGLPGTALVNDIRTLSPLK